MTNPVNRVTLIGNLGAEPEVKVFENGGKIVKFPLAVNESFKINEQWETRTQWFRCECSSFVAEKVEKYYHKGMKVFVEGRIKMNTWTNKEGQERIDIIIDVKVTHQFASLPQNQTDDIPY